MRCKQRKRLLCKNTPAGAAPPPRCTNLATGHLTWPPVFEVRRQQRCDARPQGVAAQHQRPPTAVQPASLQNRPVLLQEEAIGRGPPLAGSGEVTGPKLDLHVPGCIRGRIRRATTQPAAAHAGAEDRSMRRGCKRGAIHAVESSSQAAASVCRCTPRARFAWLANLPQGAADPPEACAVPRRPGPRCLPPPAGLHSPFGSAPLAGYEGPGGG